MDVFFVLQILFDAVLLFGVLFLFHFSVNQQQKRKEESDIIKNIQVQETKENLENLLTAIKQLGKDVSDDIDKKILESEKKAQLFQQNIKSLENELNATLELAEEIGVERNRLEDKVRVIRSAPEKKDKLPSDEKRAVKKKTKVEKTKQNSDFRSGSYGVGFSSAIVKQVYKMIDADADVSDISKATKLSKAEINLILNLRENRFTAPN